MITRIFGAVTGGRLNLRAAADSSASILASIPDETLLVVTAHDDIWYATSYGSYTGFVMKQYVTLLDLTNATEMAGEVTGGALNLRRTAATSADRLIQIPNNTANFQTNRNSIKATAMTGRKRSNQNVRKNG